MRTGDRYATMDVSDEDIRRERARSPHARQNCHGSRTQLMEDAGESVECPICLRTFTSFETQKNRAQVCPIVPSHLPDHAGIIRAQHEKKSNTPRPY